MRTSKDNLQASQQMLQIVFAKLNKAIEASNYSECCKALRAIDDECKHALMIAGTLSLQAHLHDKRR